MSLSCIHCYVKGRVQGVWFRAYTKKRASKLGLTGWVKNLPDGRVEVYACGDPEAIAALKTWLHKGPPLARVQEVEFKPAEVELSDSFYVF